MCLVSISSRTHRSAPGNSQRGFTLVELLSVVGIVATLLGLLLPTIAGAREAANRTKCQSNLHQLALAFLMYSNENDGRFPRPAQAGMPLAEDWIYYQRNRNVTDGVLARYAGERFNENIYRCPSDDVDNHMTTVSGGFTNQVTQQYRFSYSTNEQICRMWAGGQPTLRQSQVRNPSEKILLVDESDKTVDDGCWAWQNGTPPGQGRNVMSARHDAKYRTTTNPKLGRGNAAFADGHVAFIARADSFEKRYYDPRAR